MKKAILVLGIITIGSLSFNHSPRTMYSVQGNLNDWNYVLNIMEQSNAPHQDVVTAKKWIADQIQKEIREDYVKDSIESKKRE